MLIISLIIPFQVSSPKLKTPKPLAMLNEEEESSPPKEVKSSARVSRTSRTQETKTPVKMETKTPKKSQQIATPAKVTTFTNQKQNIDRTCLNSKYFRTT